jgi:hypothetical protein
MGLTAFSAMIGTTAGRLQPLSNGLLLCATLVLLFCFAWLVVAEAEGRNAVKELPGLPHDTTETSLWDAIPLIGSDTTSNTSWYALPLMYYTPETSVGGGFSAGYFFGDDPARLSSVKSDLSATLNGEYELSFNTELYLDDDRYRLWAQVNASQTPASFFGVGPNSDSDARESYTRQMVDVKLRGAHRITHALHVGLRTRVRYTSITSVDEGGLLDQDVVPGARGSSVVGVGPILFVDTRSRTYYPQSGHYISLYALAHPYVHDAAGSFIRLGADGRRFISVGEDQVLALQAYGEAVTGAPPFALLPKLGGSVRMRGYQNARFRDQVTVTTQAEWRFPIWWRIDGAVFASVGSIAPRVAELGYTGIKPAGGVGMRYELNDSGVHLRADFAVSPEGTGLYLTGSPPF